MTPGTTHPTWDFRLNKGTSLCPNMKAHWSRTFLLSPSVNCAINRRHPDKFATDSKWHKSSTERRKFGGAITLHLGAKSVAKQVRRHQSELKRFGGLSLERHGGFTPGALQIHRPDKSLLGASTNPKQLPFTLSCYVRAEKWKALSENLLNSVCHSFGSIICESATGKEKKSSTNLLQVCPPRPGPDAGISIDPLERTEQNLGSKQEQAVPMATVFRSQTGSRSAGKGGGEECGARSVTSYQITLLSARCIKSPKSIHTIRKRLVPPRADEQKKMSAKGIIVMEQREQAGQNADRLDEPPRSVALPPCPHAPNRASQNVTISRLLLIEGRGMCPIVSPDIFAGGREVCVPDKKPPHKSY
ncbi:unnamed protein product [Pleuronectes platessa]|uniref:Uncharacterized protein n=1 Tax=Pleuronectes platessa TaxID=8262 RepID=A0A9N7Z0U3_PLEPL|nr:unnamed protein product [Pleuronectes platessa]